MEKEIVNRVANSGIVNIDLEEIRPEGERVAFDIKPILFQEMILREKDIRDYIKETDWSTYQDKHVAIFCSAEAIIPTWAYMLLASALCSYASTVYFGDLEGLESMLFAKRIQSLDVNTFEDARVVIKGCSDKAVPTSAYVDLMTFIQPYAKSIMFGEPCSTVPLYKKKR